MHHLATVIAASVLLATAAGAAPKACGDDVDGRGTAVPCDCGDVLVGSRTLTDADPLVQHPCDTTALVVDVPADRTGPTLRLAGHLVRGRGRGFGLQVLRAGSTGLHLIGPGEVRGFDVGVVAWGGTLASADGVVAAENHSDGFEVNGTGYAITACEAVGNGRDGFALRGRAFRVDGSRARQNRRFGFRIVGADAALGTAQENEASGNGRGGIVVAGTGHAIDGTVVSVNGGAGVRARVRGGRIANTFALGNAADGVRASGTDLTVSGNEARDNRRRGIAVRGLRVRDGGGNGASGNAAGRAPQCAVGHGCR